MINQAGLDLIKEFEGFRAKAYADPVGVWTIGYGTTAAADVGIDPKPGMTISKADAEMYLERAVNKFALAVDPFIKFPIGANEYAAFLSLAYNIGPGAFIKSSALRKFNEGDKAGAASAILLWNKAGGKVMAGLERRRKAEMALFLTPVGHVNETPKREHIAPDVLTPATAQQPAQAPATAETPQSLWARLFAAVLGLFKPKGPKA